MPPKSNHGNSVIGKAKTLMNTEIKKRPKGKETFAKFQKDTKKALDAKKQSFSDFLGKLTITDKKKSDKLFLSLFNLSLVSVVSDNKLGANETANFKEKLQSHFHFLRAALIEQQIKMDKKEFENINITNTKLLKGAKFQEANKRLIRHKDKKNKYYDALLATLPSNSNTSKEIIEQAKYNLETNIEKEILTNKGFSIYYSQVFKVSSDLGKKGREIYGMKGPNFIAAKDESGNIFLTQMVLNPKSGRFNAKAKKKMNWFDLMLEINRNKGKYQMKEVSVDQIPYTDPLRYQKMEGDFAVKTESFQNKKIEFEEKKIFVNLKRLFMQEGLENLNEDEKKLLGKSAKEVFAKYNTHMMPFYRNGNIPFNLSYTASFKNMDIKDRMVIFRKLYNDLIRTQEKYLIQQQLEGTKGLKPVVKLFFEGELAFRRGVNFKAYNKYSNFLDKISTSKEKFDKKKELIIRARMNLQTLSLRIIDVAEKYLIASGANETWHSYAKKEHKVLVKFRELISSGKANNLDQAWNMMPKKDINMAGGSGKSRLSKIIARENKQLKGKPGGWGMSETGSPILDRFRGLAHMDEKEFKAAMFKMAQEVRKKGMIIKGMTMDGTNKDPRQADLLENGLIMAKFATEGISGAAGVLFRELMKEDMANMRSLLYNETVESTPSLGKMKTEWKSFNKIWNTVTRKKEKKSYSMVMDNYRNQLKSKKNEAEFTKQAKKIAIQVGGGKEKFNNLSTEQQFVQIDRYRNLIKSKAISDYEEKVVFNKYINSGFCKANKKVKNTYKDMMGIGGGIWNPSDAETKQMIETAAMFVFDAVTLLAPSAAVGRLGAKVVQYAGQRLMTKVIAKGGSTFWRSRAAQLGLSALAYGGGEIVGFHTMHSYLLHRRGVEELFGPRKYLEGLAHTAAFLIPMHVGGRLISPRLGRLTGAGKVPKASLKALQKMWMKAKPRLASVAAFEAPAMTILNKILDKKSGSFGKEYLKSLLAIAQFELGGKIFNSATGNIVPRGAERIAMRTKIFELKASGQKVDAARAKMIDQMMKDKTIPVESMHALAHLKPEQMRKIQDYLIENADVKLAIDLVSKGKNIPKELRPAYDYLIGNLKSMGLNAKQAKKILQSLSMDRLITLREKSMKKAETEMWNIEIAKKGDIKKNIDNPKYLAWLKKGIKEMVKAEEGALKFIENIHKIPKELRTQQWFVNMVKLAFKIERVLKAVGKMDLKRYEGETWKEFISEKNNKYETKEKIAEAKKLLKKNPDSLSKTPEKFIDVIENLKLTVEQQKVFLKAIISNNLFIKFCSKLYKFNNFDRNILQKFLFFDLPGQFATRKLFFITLLSNLRNIKVFSELLNYKLMIDPYYSLKKSNYFNNWVELDVDANSAILKTITETQAKNYINFIFKNSQYHKILYSGDYINAKVFIKALINKYPSLMEVFANLKITNDLKLPTIKLLLDKDVFSFSENKNKAIENSKKLRAIALSIMKTLPEKIQQGLIPSFVRNCLDVDFGDINLAKKLANRVRDPRMREMLLRTIPENLNIFKRDVKKIREKYKQAFKRNTKRLLDRLKLKYGNDKAKKMIDETDKKIFFSINLTLNNLLKVIKDGYFKSSWEAPGVYLDGMSLAKKTRKQLKDEAERNMGVRGKGSENDPHGVYGAVGIRKGNEEVLGAVIGLAGTEAYPGAKTETINSALQRYGKSHIKVDPKFVRDTGLFVFGDSGQIDLFSPKTFKKYKTYFLDYRGAVLAKTLLRSKSERSGRQPYVETIFTQGVKLKNISEIVVSLSELKAEGMTKTELQQILPPHITLRFVDN